MAEKVFKLNRDTYRGLTTIGAMNYPDNQGKCFTLEDCVRAWGIKDAGNTAIPAGRYRLKVNVSPAFNRLMVLVYNNPNDYSIDNGTTFSGVRIHGGNKISDTKACIIVGKTRVNDQTIKDSCESEITALVQKYEREGHEVFLEIMNLKQKE